MPEAVLSKHRRRRIRSLIPTVLTVSVLISLVATAQSPVNDCDRQPRCPVILNRQNLFFLEPAEQLSAKERAQVVSDRLLAFAQNRALAIEQLALSEQTTDRLDATVISYRPQDPEAVMLTVTDADANAVNLNRRTLAEGYLQAMKNSLQQYRNPEVATSTQQTKTLPNSTNYAVKPSGTGAIVEQAGSNPVEVNQEQTADDRNRSVTWSANWRQLLGLFLGLLGLATLIGLIPAIVNAIAGLLLRHRLQAGDRIQINQSDIGKVSQIHPFSTQLLMDDGVTIAQIPNSALFNQFIVKLSAATRLQAVDRRTEPLKFQVQVKGDVANATLEAALRSGLSQLVNVRWGELISVAAHQEPIQYYELLLSRRLNWFAKPRSHFYQEVVSVLEAACEQQEIDVFIRPVKEKDSHQKFD